MLRKKICRLLGSLCAVSLVLGGCGQNTSADALKDTLAGQESSNTVGEKEESSQESGEEAANQNGANGIENLDLDDMFSKRDKEVGFDETSDTIITLNGAGAVCDSAAVQIDGSVITITDEGTYIVSGSLENGQLIVDAEDSDKLQIVLKGADITCEGSAPLYVRKADKVFVTLAANTENSLTAAGEFEAIDDNNIDAAIFSKEDLTLNGMGYLKITASSGHGIVSKDDLVVTGGAYEIQASGHGLCGKDSVRIADGSFNITVDKDGIHSENKDDLTLGFVYIAEGSLTITAEDDGIHAGAQLVIDGGTISIPKCYEGLEGQTVDVRGGNITLTASDDGINAATPKTAEETTDIADNAEERAEEKEQNEKMAGRHDRFGGMGGENPFEVDENCYIHISGGIVEITAYGDGIDSNGNLYISGGETYVSGPESDGDGSMDFNGEGIISGGILAAAGSSGMAQNVTSASGQGCMLVKFTEKQAAGAEVILKDEAGTELLSFTPRTAYNCVIVSCPQVLLGNTYHLTAGEESQIIEMTELVYGSGGFMGGGKPEGMKGGRHENGELPNGEPPQMPEGGELPGGELPGGEPPQMPEGGELPGGEPPQMPEGGELPGGEPPQMPEGGEAPSGEDLKG